MYRMFEKCSSLKTIAIPKNVLKISEAAFLNCNKLEKVTLPDTVTAIYPSAFENCTNLKSVDMDVVSSRNITNITYAFANCDNLYSVDSNSVMVFESAYSFSLSVYPRTASSSR